MEPMRSRLLSCGLVWLVVAGAACCQGDGRAEAIWIAESARVAPAAVLRTTLVLRVQPGWHVYWVNPGEAGFAPKLNLNLPAGWIAGELRHPWPKAFKTGELFGYGHEGEVHLTLDVKAPADFKGKAVLSGELEWLACSNDACVPGSAKLSIAVEAGDFVAGPDRNRVEQAYARAPLEAPASIRLQVEDLGSDWGLEITGMEERKAREANFLCASADVLRPGVPIRFEGAGPGRFTARVPKSEYSPKSLESIELWILERVADPPLILRWRKAAKP